MDLLSIKPNVVSKGVAGKYFLFYGEPSTRKTSVAAMFPKPLLLATEIGYSLIPNVHAAPIKSWADFRDVVRQLKSTDVHDAYQTIVIDTVGFLTDMCMKYICDVNGVEELSQIAWGQGWTKFKKEFRTQLNTIAQLGYGIVLIAHSDSKKDPETGKINSSLPMMDKKPREAVIALVDFILYLNKEPKDGNPEEITVYAYSKLADIETKTRARHLKPRFEFNFENLEMEIASAVTMLGTEQPSAIAEKTVNPHTVEGIPFETLKKDVLALASQLMENENVEIQNSAKQAVVTIMKGVRVSEASSTHYDQLAALKEALIEVRDSI